MRRFVLFFVLVMICASSTSADSIVKSFQGSGGKNTRPFRVEKGWEIQWDAAGELFQLYLYDSDGDLIGVPANQQGAGKGSSYQAKGGTYYLQVNAMGNWKLNIVQVGSSSKSSKVKKNTPAQKKLSNVIAQFSGSGGKNTRPFKVPGGWEIQWDAKGELFQLYLYSSSGDLIGVPANQMGAGVGSSYQAKGGTYYLQVNAMGKWSMRIVKVK